MQASVNDPGHSGCQCPIDVREGVTFAVYAPFGTDAVLSTYPEGASNSVATHPLTRNLERVAASGINVVALIDRMNDDTWLVTIPAGRPGDIAIVSQGKQDMVSPATLATLLKSAHQFAPQASLVLALEGHGAGFLPDLDLTQLTLANVTAGGSVQWRLQFGLVRPFTNGAGSADFDKPLIAQGSPVLPIGNPTSPTNHAAMDTWATGEALRLARLAGVPIVSVVHLNNCFNMAVEVLHTIAPYAGVATGYCNYNFFTAGDAYPLVFDRVATLGKITPLALGRLFAQANHAVLLAAGHEPTIAGTVELSRLANIADRVDELADALLNSLRQSSAADRITYIDRIQDAIVGAQQYDANEDFILETPDALTDLDSFAAELLKADFGTYKVAAAADALRTALSGIKQYGDDDSPWMDPDRVFDFRSLDLAMSIFLPDPLRNGLWDWRSQYYLDVNPDPNKPRVQPHIIDFLTMTDWVDFLIEYHRDAPFVGLLPALIPDTPLATHPEDPRTRRRCGAPTAASR
ncbi:MAG TPA: hypothetical protein VH328_12475 [Burkholderiaceae bacterium]|nr:hypothetical protein [Burkholderiaceae bacterium]